MRTCKEKMDAEHADVYDALKGYEVKHGCIERETMWHLGMVWNARQRNQFSRLVIYLISNNRDKRKSCLKTLTERKTQK